MFGKALLSFAAAVVGVMPLWAADSDYGIVDPVADGLVESQEVLDSLKLTAAGRVVYQSKSQYFTNEMGGVKFGWLKGRRALTGPNCNINKYVSTVSVGEWKSSLDAVTNDDLTDVALFPAVVDATVGVAMVAPVRDMSRLYAAGTSAGYVLGSSSDKGTVLDLSLIQTMAIAFYRDGHLRGTVAVKEAGDKGLLHLDLINIPGSDEAEIVVSATSKWVFDEIALIPQTGIDASVGNAFKVKYAFVGPDAVTYPMVCKDPAGDESDSSNFTIDDYNRDFGKDYSLNMSKKNLYYEHCFVRMGMNVKALNATSEKAFDTNLDSPATYTPVLSLGSAGGAQWVATSHEAAEGEELFPAGSQAGFIYSSASILSLGVGSGINLYFLDRSGARIKDAEGKDISVTVEAGVLSLGLVSGEKNTVSAIAPVSFSGVEMIFYVGANVNLGATNIYYPFVKRVDQIEQDHRCDISPSADAGLCDCDRERMYPLRSNLATGDVSWEFVDEGQSLKPEIIEENGQWYAILPVKKSRDYHYTFRATSLVCPDKENPCTATVTLRPAPEVDYESIAVGRPIVNTDKNESPYELSMRNDGIGLLPISTLENPENILKGVDEYASYAGGTVIGTDGDIIGVHKKEGKIVDMTAEGATPKRVGFIVSNDLTALDVDALHFYMIKCYNNGKEVYSHVIDEWNTIKAGIAGAENLRKQRFSIEVPAADSDGNPIVFDEFTLNGAGLVQVNGARLNVYYPFIEDADVSSSADGAADGCNGDILSSQKDGLTFNGKYLQQAGGVNVAHVLDNMSFMIDDDPSTATLFMSTVSLGQGEVIPVNLGRNFDTSRMLGILTDDKTYLANVSAGNWLKAETYNGETTGEDGETALNLTGDELTDWVAVGARLIGEGEKGKNMLLIKPTKPYNGVRLEIAGVADALDPLKIYGLFSVSDTDADGVPDCMDTANGCNYDEIQIHWTPTSVEENTVAVESHGLHLMDEGGRITLIADSPMAEAWIYTPDGRGVAREAFASGSTSASYTVAPDIYVIYVEFADGVSRTVKALVR